MDRDTCSCCGARAGIYATKQHQISRETMQFCQLCSETLAGAHYVSNDRDSAALQAICYVGNIILSRLSDIAEAQNIIARAALPVCGECKRRAATWICASCGKGADNA